MLLRVPAQMSVVNAAGDDGASKNETVSLLVPMAAGGNGRRPAYTSDPPPDSAPDRVYLRARAMARPASGVTLSARTCPLAAGHSAGRTRRVSDGCLIGRADPGTGIDPAGIPLRKFRIALNLHHLSMGRDRAWTMAATA